MKKVFVVILFIILAITVSILLLWKIPFYAKLKSISVPDGCEEITTEIEFSDVYRLHIIGERVIKYDGGYDVLEDYVQRNNSDAKLKNISVHPFFTDRDDFAVYPNDYEVDAKEQDKYCVIEYYYQFK